MNHNFIWKFRTHSMDKFRLTLINLAAEKYYQKCVGTMYNY